MLFITPANQIITLVLVLSAIVLLALRSFIPAFKVLDKSAIILTATILFFVVFAGVIVYGERAPGNWWRPPSGC